MSEPRRERKVVTVVFCDLVGFTSRAESLDPEEVPVVVPFFIFVCLAVLLVAPGPTLPSLEAPGAG